MNITLGEGERATRAFFDAYMVGRDLEGTLFWLTDQVQWVGTGKDERSFGKEEVRSALEMEFFLDPDPYQLVWENARELGIGPGCAVFTGGLQVVRRLRDKSACAMEVRVTSCCTEGPSGWKIAAIHASSPSEIQEDGEFFPLSFAEEASAAIARSIGQNSMDLMGKNIPGGMLGVYQEPDFPLYYINDRLLQRLGYSYQEFVEAIDGRVINCVHPKDRKRVTREIFDATDAGLEYEVQYQMRRKNGRYIYVNEIGKSAKDENGRNVCLCVVRDISAEVEAKERLQRENEERERQNRRYDSLFQSVLCGIVQYQIFEDGRVIFKNANREAIRIFGYNPEEFWAVENWNIADLIAAEDYPRILNLSTSLKRVGDSVPFEYRVWQKNGEYCWIIGRAELIQDVDGEIVIQSVYLDVDERKRMELQNRQLMELAEARSEILNMALEHTSLCEFYYYPQRRRCVIPPRTSKRYHCQARYDGMPHSLAVDLVLPADHREFFQMFEKIHRGDPTSSAQFRTQSGGWCRVTMSAVAGGVDESSGCVVGIVEDITKEQTMAMALEEAKSKDPLTGLWNRENGTRMAREYMEKKDPDEHCAIMLLDMDHFTLVNEEEGIPFANAVLQEVADILRSETKEGDLQIRLGGDEFMVFLKHGGKDRAAEVGARVAARVRELFFGKERGLSISVSIGTCATEVVNEYTGLYRCAESTLKYVKESCPGQAACYLDTSNELGVQLTNLYTETHPVNRIEQENPERGEDLISFALDLLGKAKRLDDAVSLLFSRVGKTYGLDRVSLLDVDPDFLSCRFPYQWARDNGDLQVGTVFYITREQYRAASGQYDFAGFCRRDVNEELGQMASCIQAGIWDHGIYVGALSFEVKREGYVWTEELQRLLQELNKIISSFVMKAKADAVSQAKTDFLSRMSHEIRTPMNAIVGMTAIARSVAGNREKVLECLDKLEGSNQYLLNLINDILDMSRIESGKMELNPGNMDLDKFIGSLVGMLRPQAEEKGIRFTVDNGYVQGRPLLADRLRLEQVLINIIGNAVKFTPEGGKIEFSVVPLKETKEALLLRFSVKDTGIGIASENLDSIFNAFEQAEKSTAATYGGTGLGLTISSRLVQMMGGTLGVSSEPGKGSEFSFALSLPWGAAVSRDNHTPETEKNDFGGKRILVVEDNELNREIAQTLLEMHGFAVETAENGQMALDSYSASRPGYYDAVLMDIRMPVMDGIEATKRLRTMGRPDSRTIPIVAMTANAFDEDSKKSLESGMNGHLSKPIRIEELLLMLEKCIH